MKKPIIAWEAIAGLPGCYDHDKREYLPKDHAVMIKQAGLKDWRIYYTLPYPEFIGRKELKVASEGSITLTVNPFQVTIMHELKCFNRCKIAGRFYIEPYLGGHPDATPQNNKEVERAIHPRKDEAQATPL